MLASIRRSLLALSIMLNGNHGILTGALAHEPVDFNLA